MTDITAKPAYLPPTIYLSTNGNASYLLHLEDLSLPPAFLISYVMLESWPKRRATTPYRYWMMDSGAFSVLYSGRTVTLEEYIRCCQEKLAEDKTLVECIALDVIRDWRQSLRNTELMWAAGVPAIPVYHIGEPEDVLIGYARDYPKIAIGGLGWLRGSAVRKQYAEQCFARVWPCAVHGLALTGEEILQCVPWHSVDASSWVAGPRYGTWRVYAGGRNQWGRLSARKQYDLRPEVEVYLRMEEKLRFQWSKEMAEVDTRLRAANWRGYQGGDDANVYQSPGHRAGHPLLA